MSNELPTENKNRSFSLLNDYYETAGAILVTIGVLLFLGFGIYFFSTTNTNIAKTQFISIENPQTTQIKQLLKNKDQADSLIVQLYLQNVSLTDSIKTINASIQSINYENNYTENRIKMFASIIGIIIAVVGFFGFKSLNDIREHSIKNAQFDSKEIAQKTASNVATITAKEVLNDDYISKKFNESFEKTSNLYENQTKTINEHIEALNKRLLLLEQLKENTQQEQQGEQEVNAEHQEDEVNTSEDGDGYDLPESPNNSPLG